MYEQPSTIIDYFRDDAVIAVDEFNRVKETEETLTTEVDDFISNLIEWKWIHRSKFHEI